MTYTRDDINLIFKKPKHFGLRGDDELWDWLKTSYVKDSNNLSELPGRIKNDLKDFGVDIELNMRAIQDRESYNQYDTEIYIKAFDKGGMSGGGISIHWWCTVGCPLLNSRISCLLLENSLYEEMKQG